MALSYSTEHYKEQPPKGTEDDITLLDNWKMD